jgi:hypothetical protein
MKWPQLTNPAYADTVVQAVADGRVEHTFVPITVSANGHQATFQVSQDALKIGGVRINASAFLQQRIADLIGAHLVTPKLLDQMWKNRAVTILPCTQPAASSAAAMARHSACVDRELAAAGGNPTNGIVQTVGKTWVLSNLLSPTIAMNMGWHLVQPLPGVPYDPAPTLHGEYLIQSPGTHHDPNFVDYSQVCLFVDAECVVDGAYSTFAEVAQSPDLWPLVSHEGPLRFLRQPGLPGIGMPIATAETVVPPSESASLQGAGTMASVAFGAGVGGLLAGPPGALAGASIGWAADMIRRQFTRRRRGRAWT